MEKGYECVLDWKNYDYVILLVDNLACHNSLVIPIYVLDFTSFEEYVSETEHICWMPSNPDSSLKYVSSKVKKMKKTKIIKKILAMAAITMLTISVFSAEALAEDKKKPNVNAIKIQYLAKTSGDSYYIQFKTCIGSNPVNKPSFSIMSDTDSKFVKYEKLHLANTCKNYETTVGAKSPNSILIQMTNETMKK